MKLVVKLFIYASVIALIIYLYSLDYLVFKTVSFNYYYLGVSIVFLFSGFVFSALSWKYALRLHGVKINRFKAIVSHGLPVFTKYIPGRVWTILGRAALVRDEENDIKRLSFISFKEQLIYLCLGFIISIYPVFKTEKIQDYSWLIIIISIIMLLVLLSRRIQQFAENLWNKAFKRQLNIPKISVKEFTKLSVYIIFYWLLWTIGFYFLLASVFEIEPFYYAFAFPLSISLGLIAVIFPGGIGVREGVITLFLISNGVQADLVISFSIICRIWFLIGEIFMFFLALSFKKKSLVFK